MTTITIDRATVEQALEALELYVPKEDYENKPVGNVMDALRAALAEPQSTHSAACYQWHHKCAIAEVERLRAALAEPDSDSPERRCGGPGCDMRCCQPVQEPVAWLFTNLQSGDYDFCYQEDGHDHDREMWHKQPLYTSPPQRSAEPVQEPVAKCVDDICSEHLGRVEAFDHLPRGTLLYAAPPQRKPLPASEIVTMYDENPRGDSDMIAFARAIERAHGIGGEG